jgi:hypothetical protein
MGWSGGTVIAKGLIEIAKKTVKDIESRKTLYREIINILEDEDWDTQYEVVGEDHAFDSVLMEIHPDWDWRDTDE